MKNVAFVTYNTLPNLPRGWVRNGDRSALIVQDTKGQGTLSDNGRKRTLEEVRSAIEAQWEELDKSLPNLDHLVIYVGASGSELAIQRAKAMPVEKLTFVGCACGIDRKDEMLNEVGLGEARRFGCECGGHRTMELMVFQFMEIGTIF